MSLKSLMEKRGTLAAEIKRLAGTQENWTAEDRGAWDKVNADYDATMAAIEVEERAAKVSGEAPRLPPPGSHSAPPAEKIDRARDESLAIAGWIMGANAEKRGKITDEHRDAAARIGINLDAREIELRLPRWDRRAMGVSSGYGGETIPLGFVAGFETALKSFAGIRDVCENIRTASGEPMVFATCNDTTAAGAMINENTQDSEASLTTSGVTLNAYKGTSRIILVSAELLQDSTIDIASYIGQRAGERIGRLHNAQGTTGTGSSAPKGIVTAATAVRAADDYTIASDDLITLFHSVDPAYRNAAMGCGWMMNDQIAKVLRKLKDGDNQYLWQPGLQAGQPDMLLGFPVRLNQGMASSVLANAKTILFGAMRKFVFREVGSIRLKRLVERYADYDQEGFIAYTRFDCDLIDAGTHPVYVLQQALLAGSGTGSGSGA